MALSPNWCMEQSRTWGSRLATLESLKGPHLNNLLGDLDIVNLAGYFLMSGGAAFLGVFYSNISGVLSESNHMNLE